jgi:hypothetical protein
MKKFLIILVIVIVAGFIVAIPGEDPAACTLIGCPIADVSEDGIHEIIDCNSCSVDKAIFKLWILNVSRQCRAQRVVTYEDGQYISARTELDESACSYRWWSQLFG